MMLMIVLLTTSISPTSAQPHPVPFFVKTSTTSRIQKTRTYAKTGTTSQLFLPHSQPHPIPFFVKTSTTSRIQKTRTFPKTRTTPQLFLPHPIPRMISSSTPSTTIYPKVAAFPTTTEFSKGPQDIFKVSPHYEVSDSLHDIDRIVARRDMKLQVLLNKLEKIYKDYGMDVIHEGMTRAWQQIVEEDQRHPSITMKNLQMFVDKVVADYNLGIKECIYDDWEDAWNHYIIAFGRRCAPKEKEMRKAIFKKNMENVQKHNMQFDLGKVSYSTKLNHFSDRTPEELKKMKDFRPHVGARHKHPMLIGNEVERYQYNRSSKVPDSFDWRLEGYVTPVQFQGDCCSCYAYAGLGALEAPHMKKTGNLVRLSVQNILDCTWDLGNDGCDGGSIHSVFEYAQTKGVESQDLYPYTVNASHNCLWEKEHVVATSHSFLAVPKGNEMALQHAIVNYGPVAVGIGTTDDFFSYGSGVFHPSRCDSADHSVLVVGYGTSPVHGDYWIVKNSFGKWWGEDGYIRIARNKDNVCDVASYAMFPI